MTEEKTILAVDKHKLAQQKAAAGTQLAALKAAPSAPWAEWLEYFNTAEKAIDAERMEVKRPLLDDCNRIDAEFAPVLKEVRAAKAFCKKKREEELEAFALEQGRLQEAARLAAQAGDAHAAQDALVGLQHAEAPAGGKTTWVWVYEVTNEDEIPRSLLTIDDYLVQALIAGCEDGDETPSAPGLKFTRKAKVSATGKRKK